MAAPDATLSKDPVQRLYLLSLPAELRNQIWKHTLGGTVFEVYCWPSYDTRKIASRILNRQKNFLSLLRTFHQIYSEARLFPFNSNAFRIKSEDGIPAFLNKFEASEREAIAELHLVTLGAARMVEGLSYFPKTMPDLLALQRFPGLRRLCIEVRMKSGCRCCRLGHCNSWSPDIGLVEKNLREHVAKENPRVEVVFRRSLFASLSASQAL
ncbi:hypothetical protein IQ07DRAFT_667264 [Pyrenochaeta sp. DS3sAY3a]|nr:hypothetical protein IQ07DRAFT_667264 [Pyrenochaeta sp. DS3sAY3a]